MTFFKKHTDSIIIILLAILSRLPYLLSPSLMLDGDECIVGLMSKHFVEGKGLPFFFYGQSYGFSFIEVLFISGGYTIAGISDYVVKGSVLVLWVIGVWFFYKTLLAVCRGNKTASLMMVLVLIVSPAWLLWSMKARGGYVTAFTLSSMVLYLVLAVNQLKTKWALVGAFCVILFYSQPLWLAGLLPFTIYGLNRGAYVKQLASAIGGSMVMLLLFQLMMPSVQEMWQPTVFTIPDEDQLSMLAKSIYSSLGGHYYLMEAFQQPILVAVFVWVFLLIVIVSCIYVLAFWQKADALSKTAFASLLLSILSLLFIDLSSIRYALPFMGYALLFIAIVWRTTAVDLKLFLPVFAMLIAGVFSLNKFAEQADAQQKKSHLQACIDTLIAKEITHVYCNGPLEQWRISFYSEEAVIARYFYTKDRYLPYIYAVDSVYLQHSEKTALVGVGYADESKGALQVNSSFYIIPSPNIEILSQMGFAIQ